MVSKAGGLGLDTRMEMGSDVRHVFVAGLSYKTAPVAIREQFACPSSDHSAVADRLRREHDLAEIVLLWTCNRVEIYGATTGAPPDARALMQGLLQKPIQVGSEIYCHRGPDAVRHLLSVASGMDSMVLGETEILGQVKNAYERARTAGHTGKRMNRLFQKALETSKEVRSTTAIGKGAASVGSVAVQHAQKIFGATLRDRKVMVIGAGDMAAKCLRHLVKKGVTSIFVVNRSVEKAEALAAEFGGTAVSFGRCLDAMADMDIVLTSTGCPHIILERSDIATVMAARPDRRLAIIDIAVPRDVAPEAREIPGVHLYDIGHLEDTVRENIRFREQDLALCWTIIGAKAAEVESALIPMAPAQGRGGMVSDEHPT